MRAARYYDRGDIRIDEIAEPVVTPGTVGIDVAWCGICGSDLHEYMEGPIFIPPAGHPHPISGESAPVTMGHEMSGVVYAVGSATIDSASGTFVRIPQSVDQSAVAGDPVEVSVEVVDYRGVWVPTAGAFESIEFGGPRPADLTWEPGAAGLSFASRVYTI